MHISSHRKGNVRISNEGLLGMFSTSKMDDFRGFRLVSCISWIVSEKFCLQQKPNEIWVSWTIMYTTKEVITFSETFLKREGSWGFLRIAWFRCLHTRFVSQRLGADHGSRYNLDSLSQVTRDHNIQILFRILWITWIVFFGFAKVIDLVDLVCSLQALSGLDHLWPRPGRCANWNWVTNFPTDAKCK